MTCSQTFCYNVSCSLPSTGAAFATYASAVQFFAATQVLVSEGIYPDTEISGNETYDFIIVGGGSVGCVLANRLSEIKNWNILLIEAGGDPPIEASIPGLTSSMWQSQFDWGYRTTNNGITNKGTLGNAINWPRGKMLGGCSNINFMTYAQGSDEDYKKWCDAGNKEWCLEDVRRCFKKSVNLQDNELNQIPLIYQHYGHDGPLVVNTFNITYRSNSEKVLSAFEEIGIKHVQDINVANGLGSGIIRVTSSNGERNSLSKSYLKTVLHRSNLHIKKNTMVTKILLNQQKRAYGVSIEHKGKKSEVYATNDIIISAGTVNSPQLLMLSGIGCSKHLNSKNIETFSDLPMVGKNLKDHVFIPITIFTNESNEINQADTNFDVLKYFYNRTGSLAEIGFYDISAFYSLDEKAKYPDYQIYLNRVMRNSANLRESLIKMSQYKEDIIDSIVELNKNNTLYLFYISLLHPHSSGNISLNSKESKAHPFIFPDYFKDRRDLEMTVSGIEFFLNVLNTTFFKSVGGFLGRMKWPECDKFELGSSNYWRCICINMVGTVYHPIGTCKMGSDPSNSVVNGRLKVHGIENLRVIDASVMPSTVSGNTNGPCVMIGERGAEIIKDDYKIML